MSGSDIKEACRDAAMGPVREFIRQRRSQGGSGQRRRGEKEMQTSDVRGLRTDDFFGQGKRAKEMETLDDVEDEGVPVRSAGRVSDSEESTDGTLSSEEKEKFRDSAFQDAAEEVRR